MNFMRKVLSTLGGVLLAALLIAALAPKATHGLVAALVQVANTDTNPVPTIGVDAHNSFVVQGGCVFGGANACAITPLYTAPAGQIAVIESGSGLCQVDSGTAPIEFRLDFNGISVEITPNQPVPYFGGIVFTAGQNLKTYASGEIDAFIDTNKFQSSAGSENCRLSISGHLAPQ